MASRKKKKGEAPAEPEFDIFEDDNFADLSLSQRVALTEFIKNNGWIVDTCKKAKITRATWYYWKKTDERFRQVLAEIDEFFTDELVAAAHSHAKAGDGVLLKFLLEAARRDKYDSRYIRQKMVLERELQPIDGFAPVRATLVRDEEPDAVKKAKGG